MNFIIFLSENDMEMYSTHNKGRCVFVERFIRTLNSKIYKCITSISKICILIN